MDARNTRAKQHDGDPQWNPDIDPKTGAAWARFRGRGRKGRQSHATTDATDLAVAMRTLARGTELLVRAHDRATPRQRKAEIAEALGMLSLVTRQIDEIIARRGGRPADCDVLDEESGSDE